MKGTALVALCVALAACNRDTPNDAAAATAGRGGTSSGGTGQSAPGGRGGQTGGGTGRGRGPSSITLASTDITVVQPITIEDVTPISGDLRPIETVDIRSRLEGNIDKVYVREGEVVHQGQLLARFESSDQESTRRSAEADRASAEADVATAQWNAEQSAKLLKAGAISERDDKVAQQTLASAKARLAATEARLRTSDISLRDTRILSTTNGIVDKRLIEAGEHVLRGAALFSVVRNDMLELVAAMPARDANSVRVGQTVRFTADARQYTGHVARLSPTIDPVTRSVTVYAQVPNSNGELRGGTFATGQVVSQTIPNVLAIPRDAVHQRQGTGESYVYRIVNKTIDVTTVKLGVTDERLGVTQIVEGLEAGDRIVSGNVGTIGRGMQVSIAGGDSSAGERQTGRLGGGNGGRGGRTKGQGRGTGKP